MAEAGPRALLRQISRLGLERIGAEGELDIVQPDTPLGEFYRLSGGRQ